jgi:peptide/nickel transport system ATP-binding protein
VRHSASRPEPLLEIQGLLTQISTRRGAFPVVDGLNLAVHRGEAVGLVGESGSGKSMTAHSVLRLLPAAASIVSGRVLFKGWDLLGLSEEEMRLRIRGREISMILQDPMSSLNPVYTVGQQLVEALRTTGRESRRDHRAQAIQLLERVRIPEAARRMHNYPHELSGGMRQRVLTAIALAGRPSLLIADEPTTALDTTVQAQILRLLRSLQDETGMSILFITHDLGLVANMCDRVAVMYAGRVVEQGSVLDVLKRPAHPYTRGLIASVPRLTDETERLTEIPGQPPSPSSLSAGCPFAPRCSQADSRCHEYPPIVQLVGEHSAACWFADAQPFTKPFNSRPTHAHTHRKEEIAHDPDQRAAARDAAQDVVDPSV